METQLCSKCRIEKPIEDFHKRSDRPRKGTVSWCSQCTAAYDAAWYKENKARICARVKAIRRAQRGEALEHYGNKCVCCGEFRYQFLDFDHKYNDGNKHRKQMIEERKKLGYKGTGGWVMVEWLRRNGYPDSIQILCKNCNGAKVRGNRCPHEIERDAIWAIEAKYPPVPESIAIN